MVGRGRGKKRITTEPVIPAAIGIPTESSQGDNSNSGVAEQGKGRIDGTITQEMFADAQFEKSESEMKTVLPEAVEPREKTDDTAVLQRPMGKGMSLAFIAPTLKEGVPIACLEPDKINIEAQKWEHAVILYVVGENPSIRYLQTYLEKQCKVGKPEIFYHMDDYFVVRFRSKEERNLVLYAGPHTIANRPTIVKVWEAGFNFEKEVLKIVPLWIQLPNLPLNCWGLNSLSRIGSLLGTPICADECTSMQTRISYARLLVEIHVTQPLQYKVWIEGENGKKIEQKVVYDWVPPFCKKCQAVGHDCSVFVKDKQYPHSKPQWLPKDTGKRDVVPGPTKDKEKGVEEWKMPKKTASPGFMGETSKAVQIGNTFVMLEEAADPPDRQVKGGDQFPFVDR